MSFRVLFYATGEMPDDFRAMIQMPGEPSTYLLDAVRAFNAYETAEIAIEIVRVLT